jgi:hypothetical protein
VEWLYPLHKNETAGRRIACLFLKNEVGDFKPMFRIFTSLAFVIFGK